MIRTLLSIALNRGLTGEDHYIRCARCRATASALEGAPLIISSQIRMQPGRFSQTTTPPEWTCPRCGRPGPLEVGELLANDTTVRCRRRLICRHRWKVPASLEQMTCPRCSTVQPGPAGCTARRSSSSGGGRA